MGGPRWEEGDARESLGEEADSEKGVGVETGLLRLLEMDAGGERGILRAHSCGLSGEGLEEVALVKSGGGLSTMGWSPVIEVDEADVVSIEAKLHVVVVELLLLLLCCCCCCCTHWAMCSSSPEPPSHPP